MSRKELARTGLLAAAVAGRSTNREGAAAVRVTPRQFQRLKQRVREGGAANTFRNAGRRVSRLWRTQRMRRGRG